MKKVLSIIDSEKYLLIVLDLMLNHLEKDCVYDLAISDSIKNFDCFIDRIKKTKLFNEVFIISPKKEDSETGKYGRILAKFIRNIHFSKKNIQRKLLAKYPKLQFNYDYIIFYDPWYLNNMISRAQENVEKFIWIDDGLSSYVGNSYKGIGSLGDKIRLLFKANYLQHAITEQYLFRPELRQYNTPFPCKKLAPFNAHDERFLLPSNTIFNVHDSFSFKERFIYIDQPFDDDGLPFSNIYFLDMITKGTSEKNILVKPHPRSSLSQYEGKYSVFIGSGTPWELILMNKKQDSCHNILIGSMSTALISPFLFFNDRTPVIMLLNFIDLNLMPEKFIKQVDFIKKVCISNPDVFFLPKDEAELAVTIKKLENLK